MLNSKKFASRGVLPGLLTLCTLLPGRGLAADCRPPSPPPAALVERFGEDSCLRQSAMAPWINDRHELVLTMTNGVSVGLLTTTSLSYGRYTARIMTDLGGGAVAAFYLMGVDGQHRDDPAYRHLHDEIDIELVGTLWRQNQHLADHATWFNAYHDHTTLVLPRSANDDAGGSMLAIGNRAEGDDALFRRNILADVPQTGGFWGHNFNDGQYYTYSIDYSASAITYTVANDAGTTLLSYTLKRQGDAWPSTAMYLALSLWSTDKAVIQNDFCGKLDLNFGRPMRAFISEVTYQPAPGVALPGVETWHGELPWRACNLAAQGCYRYNRDGVTCQQVGMYEGQVGTPWGSGAGTWRCTSGCLQQVHP